MLEDVGETMLVFCFWRWTLHSTGTSPLKGLRPPKPEAQRTESKESPKVATLERKAKQRIRNRKKTDLQDFTMKAFHGPKKPETFSESNLEAAQWLGTWQLIFQFQRAQVHCLLNSVLMCEPCGNLWFDLICAPATTNRFCEFEW